MKTRSLIVGISVVIVLVVSVVVVTTIKNYVNTSFATEVSIKFHYRDNEIDVVVTDENDIRVLKECLNGASFRDNPSCGFSLDVSIQFSDGDKSIILCPACDECSSARVGDTDWYINIKGREALEAVLRKYGMTFPCV